MRVATPYSRSLRSRARGSSVKSPCPGHDAPGVRSDGAMICLDWSVPLSTVPAHAVDPGPGACCRARWCRDRTFAGRTARACPTGPRRRPGGETRLAVSSASLVHVTGGPSACRCSTRTPSPRSWSRSCSPGDIPASRPTWGSDRGLLQTALRGYRRLPRPKFPLAQEARLPRRPAGHALSLADERYRALGRNGSSSQCRAAAATALLAELRPG